MPATITACVAALTLLAAFLLYQQASGNATQQQRADAARTRTGLRDVLDTAIGRVQDVAAAASEHWPSRSQFDGLADGLLQSQALDRVSTSVILADASQTIIYINDIGAAMFARTQSQIARTLPGFSAANLLGSSLDRLAADPALQHRVLEQMTGSQVQDVKLGECTFRIVVSTVVARDGQRIGTVM